MPAPNVTAIRKPTDLPSESGNREITLSTVTAPVRHELVAVERAIQAQLKSDVALISQMGAYLVAAGGKRLRPITVLLAAHSIGYQGKDHIALAAIVELIHTATLLHDDVVDESTLRRGRETANAVWGNAASVLVGDFIYSRSFEMMVDTNRMRVMEIMAATTNAIAEGATALQPPCASDTWPCPCHGAVVDPFCPACHSWIPIFEPCSRRTSLN